MKSDLDRLNRVRELLDSDVAHDADAIYLKHEKYGSFEIAMGKLISSIYKAVHPDSGCGNKHEDWDNEW